MIAFAQFRCRIPVFLVVEDIVGGCRCRSRRYGRWSGRRRRRKSQSRKVRGRRNSLSTQHKDLAVLQPQASTKARLDSHPIPCKLSFPESTVHSNHVYVRLTRALSNTGWCIIAMILIRHIRATISLSTGSAKISSLSNGRGSTNMYEAVRINRLRCCSTQQNAHDLSRSL